MPIVVVRKPDSSIRLCVDYRKLNSVIVRDAYPLPRVEDTIDAMAGASYFSTLDLASGFWQVELTNAAQVKSAFGTPFGLFQWNVMPFGLCNAPATFQRLMANVLDGLIPKVCNGFIDDVITFSQEFDGQLSNLRLVFTRLRAASLKIKPKKCKLIQRSVVYLGHVFSARGVSPDPTKFSAVQAWPVPTSAHDVRRFVGLASYYRRFIPKFADIASPLHTLTQKKVAVRWTDECQSAFDELKQRLVSAPILALRCHPDRSSWTRMHC